MARFAPLSFIGILGFTDPRMKTIFSLITINPYRHTNLLVAFIFVVAILFLIFRPRLLTKDFFIIVLSPLFIGALGACFTHLCFLFQLASSGYTGPVEPEDIVNLTLSPFIYGLICSAFLGISGVFVTLLKSTKKS
jgi:hypothetical protein